MKKWVVVYEWPSSQLCLSCVHKTNDILDDSAAICSINATENDGVECDSFEENKDEDEVDEVCQ